jgi:hypothetical protein
MRIDPATLKAGDTAFCEPDDLENLDARGLDGVDTEVVFIECGGKLYYVYLRYGAGDASVIRARCLADGGGFHETQAEAIEQTILGDEAYAQELLSACRAHRAWLADRKPQ